MIRMLKPRDSCLVINEEIKITVRATAIFYIGSDVSGNSSSVYILSKMKKVKKSRARRFRKIKDGYPQYFK
jgi:hypothetical protein